MIFSRGWSSGYPDALVVIGDWGRGMVVDPGSQIYVGGYSEITLVARLGGLIVTSFHEKLL